MHDKPARTLERRNLVAAAGAVVAAAPSDALAQATPPGPDRPQIASIRAVHHVGVRTFDKEASKQFWCGTLGMVAHPEKDNWLGVEGSDHRSIHLMPAAGLSAPGAGAGEDEHDLAKHVALEVADLRTVVARLLEAGCKPFQGDLDPSRRRSVTAAGDPLDFGIGTVFVFDPAGNVVEFIQRDFGIFAKIKG